MTTQLKKEKRKYSSEDIKNYLEEWRASGKSQIAFSKEKDLNYFTLNKWINQGKSKKPLKQKAGVFTELRLPSPPSLALFAEIKKDGFTVVLHQAVSADFLRTLIK